MCFEKAKKKIARVYSRFYISIKCKFIKYYFNIFFLIYLSAWNSQDKTSKTGCLYWDDKSAFSALVGRMPVGNNNGLFSTNRLLCLGRRQVSGWRNKEKYSCAGTVLLYGNITPSRFSTWKYPHYIQPSYKRLYLFHRFSIVFYRVSKILYCLLWSNVLFLIFKVHNF